jgi:tetratricopeptide (TPR) repeat protein
MRIHIAAIVVVLTICGCEDKESRIQSFLLKGNEEVNKGDTEKALYYYSEALKLDSCFVDALNNIGTVHHKAHRFKDAIASYSKAIGCKPDYSQAWFHRANSYYESGEYYNALKDIDHLTKATPDSSLVYFLKGLVLVKLAGYAESVEAFKRALQLGYPKEIECRINIATSRIFMKEYDAAKSELQACLKIDGKSVQAYNSLSLIAIEQHDFNEAVKQANKGLELSPREPYLLNNRGFAYLELGRFEEAQNDINESIIMDPYNSWAYRNKGVLELKKKNFTEAARLLNKARTMDPNTERVDEYLAMIPKKSK